jgi:AraC family transcriptional regulator
MLNTQPVDAGIYSPLLGLSWQQISEGDTANTSVSLSGNGPGTSLSDLSSVYPETVIASSQDLVWHNIRVLQVHHEYSEMDLPPFDNHCVVVDLESAAPTSASIDGHDFDSFISRGDIAIIPAGTSSHWHWADSGPHDNLQLYLHPQFVQKTAEMCDLSHGQIVFPPRFGVRDEQLSHLAMSLLHELKEANLDGRLYADSIASVLAIQLLRRYSPLKLCVSGRADRAP